MLIYPEINPVAFSIGPIKVHWYGIMYLVGFVAAWVLGLYRAKQPWTVLNNRHQVGDAIFYGAWGVILGGRLGYMLFYDFYSFIHHPWIIVRIWDGGMSFHGGLIGAIIAYCLYSRKLKCHIFDLTDFFAPMVPIGLACGRLGNFINGELWGRVTTSPIGMVFPTGGPLPRYPSQLIELLLEGVLLFIVLWVVSLKPRKRAVLSAYFLIGYGILRIIAEFFRQPDSQLGFILWHWVTMGMLLSLPMILLGLLILLWAHRNKTTQPKASDQPKNERG